MDERVAGVRSVFWNAGEKRLRALFRIPVMLALTLLAAQVVVGLVGGVASVVAVPGPIRQALTLGLLSVAVLALTWFVDRRRLRDVGMSGDSGWWLDLAAGLVVGLGMVAAVVVSLRVTGHATVGGHEVADPDVVLGGGSAGVVYGLLFFGAVGFFEELLLRGYLLVNVAEGLRGSVGDDRTAVLVAIVATAGLFGLLHAANPGGTRLSLLNITLAGLFFGAAYAVTDRIAFPVGVHVAWNFGLGSVFGLPVSGLTTDTALVGVETSGPRLLTGGSFGPEGGLVMLLALALGVGAFVWWSARRDGPPAIDGRLAVPDLWVEDADA